MDHPAQITDTRPALECLAYELAASERLRAFVADIAGTSARVSEPLLPLVLAAVWFGSTPRRGLVCLLPDDGDARNIAEAAGWFLGAGNVGLLPSRGVRLGSGLEPPPHLVGERARALEVFAEGGLVCASALGLAEGLPPAGERARTITVALGEEPGVDGLA